MPDSKDEERARLHGYIAASKQVQKKLGLGVGLAVVVCIVAIVIAPRIGGFMLLGTAIIGVCGFWVTAAHIADWRLKLRTLDQNSHPGGMRISRKRSS